MFRKGSILLWEDIPSLEPSLPVVEELQLETEEEEAAEGEEKELSTTTKSKRKIKIPKIKRQVIIVFEDLMNDSWWEIGRGKDSLKD